MNLDKILKELQSTYIQGMPKKIKAMQKHQKAQDFKALREEFHKIKGTGKTYGLPEITELGALFEEVLIKSDFQPHNDWISDAIELFQDIYSARLNQQNLDISTDKRFKNLQNVLSELKK